MGTVATKVKDDIPVNTVPDKLRASPSALPVSSTKVEVIPSSSAIPAVGDTLLVPDTTIVDSHDEENVVIVYVDVNPDDGTHSSRRSRTRRLHSNVRRGREQ